jgi:starch phosphorylase
MYPERFHNVTNGITYRRWLIEANPKLAALISGAIGDGWTRDLEAFS